MRQESFARKCEAFAYTLKKNKYLTIYEMSITEMRCKHK